MSSGGAAKDGSVDVLGVGVVASDVEGAVTEAGVSDELSAEGDAGGGGAAVEQAVTAQLIKRRAATAPARPLSTGH